ncbi:hypothetical protein CEUSTIGMA_g4902.t1 [Chlamydomonas eustigma]|uniref:Uncharacterized protein n=1 Tax=Chlamydomonas eustigma TaxID=1157962 RepID=A0A250X311_9CHLO|nr:hypothetical protein CEUSTIGMA_g4902.t1 [Chlamydomonas eustigma]|eukprot:GAX77458.1 hypothetical protein CEUSTIGMA_g4902.t1 [Chlamydomonas eustigma]
MTAPKHGRRAAKIANEAGFEPVPLPHSNDTVFKLEVRVNQDTKILKLPPQLLSNEYSTRYLEKIGVKPTKSTMEMVNKNIALTESCIKTTLRSKGHIQDQVLLTVPAVQHSIRIPTVISALSVAQLGLNNQEDKRRQDEQGTSSSNFSSGQTPSAKREPGRPVSSNESFRAMASPFLHPFNLDTRVAKENIERIRRRYNKEMGLPKGARSRREEEVDSNAFMPGGEVCQELVQELIVTPELILTVMAPLEAALLDWYKVQAAETLKGRLSKEDFQSTLELLASDSTINFFATTINFLHEEFIKSSPLYSRELELKVANESRMSRLGSRRSTVMSCGPTPNISRPMALQQYDLGYRIFVEEKMMVMREEKWEREQNPPLSVRRTRATVKAPVPSMMELPSGSLQRGLSSLAPEVEPSSLSRAHSHALIECNLGRPSVTFQVGKASSTKGLDSLSSTKGLDSFSKHSSAAPSLSEHDIIEEGNEEEEEEGDRYVLTDKDGNPMLEDAPMPVRRSLRYLSSAFALSSAALARTILEGLGAEDTDYLQRTRLFALQKEFAALYQQQRQNRAGMFFCLPLFLLFLRISVTLLFSSLYPMWSKSEQGKETLEKMDATLIQMLDPHGYLERSLSLVESSPAAVSILAKYPHKSHEAERSHFSDISPLLRAALPEPSSAAARRMLVTYGSKSKGASKVKAELTEAQREALYQDARKLAASHKSNLRKIGEPVQHTTRDSWIVKPDS